MSMFMYRTQKIYRNNSSHFFLLNHIFVTFRCCAQLSSNVFVKKDFKMAAPQYLPFGRLLFVALLSLFWGTFITLKMLWEIIKVGPRRYFHKKNRPVRPEVLDDPNLGEHHYARLSGIRLHYVARGPTDRPLVLFLHGFPEFWYSWRYQLREIGQNYRAVAVDMRGYGESDRPQGIAEYRMEKLTGDIKEFIEHLGYTKCYLVSHDWGGAVAWGFAARYPQLVEKLIVCNCPHFTAFSKYINTHMSQLLKSWYMFLFQLPLLPEIYLGKEDCGFLRDIFTSPKVGVKAKYMSEDDIEAFVYTFKDRADRTGPVNYYRAVMRYMPDKLKSDKIQCPTLIIWGTNDLALEKSMADASKAYVEAPCRVHYVEGATHWVQQDEPEVVNRQILEFLADNKSD